MRVTNTRLTLELRDGYTRRCDSIGGHHWETNDGFYMLYHPNGAEAIPASEVVKAKVTVKEIKVEDKK